MSPIPEGLEGPERQDPVAVFSHVVTDEVYTPDGRLQARTVGGAGAYAAVGASLVASAWRTLIVSGAGAADRKRLTGWFREREIDPGGLFEVGEHSPVTRVRYRPDGERVEDSRFGDAHFAAHTPYPSRMPVEPKRPAGAYLFHGVDVPGTGVRFWREVPDLRARCAGPVLWEIAADACAPRQLPRVLELAALIDVLSLNVAEAAALTGRADPLDALDLLRRTGLTVVLRCGPAGSLVHHEGERVRVGVAPGRVVDPTGGGNAYSGAFLAAFAASGDAVAAARLAASAAALVIGEYGAPAVGEPTRAEVRRGAMEVPTAAT
ncbi:carbohydrate kinase family protein [Streptomyces sp. NPDC056716]|uniref:carbohydrate kinase family protein n=1 Tax=unclassified Streptomyces TaxID=2593676 RepID=UPI00367CF20D